MSSIASQPNQAVDDQTATQTPTARRQSRRQSDSKAGCVRELWPAEVIEISGNIFSLNVEWGMTHVVYITTGIRYFIWITPLVIMYVY